MKPIERTRKEVFERWVEALESGKYQQTQGVLREKTSNGRYAYCCLGVLCHLAEKDGGPKFKGEEFQSQLEMPPENILNFMFSESNDPEGEAGELAQMNDNGYTFKEIAKHIREHFMKEFKSI